MRADSTGSDPWLVSAASRDAAGVSWLTRFVHRVTSGSGRRPARRVTGWFARWTRPCARHRFTVRFAAGTTPLATGRYGRPCQTSSFSLIRHRWSCTTDPIGNVSYVSDRADGPARRFVLETQSEPVETSTKPVKRLSVTTAA